MKLRKMELLVLLLAVSLIAGAANADITTGLVGYWKLDDGSGTTAVDSSGYGNDGTLEGSPEWKTTGDDFRIGTGALDFVYDDSDYVDCGNDPIFNITDEITVSVWIKVSEFNQRFQVIVGKDGGSWMLSRNRFTDNLRWYCEGITGADGNYYVTGTVPVNDGEWHHIAGVYDGSTISLYTDGVLDVSQSAFGPINTNDHPVWISGRAIATDRWWNGLIDDVRVYNQGLSADDIMELYLYRGDTATNIKPTNGAELVAIDTNLSWGPPPVFTPSEYDLYYKVGDPNFATGTVIEVLNILRTDPCNVHTPAANFANDTTIYWRVDSYAPSYPDPCIGGVCSFKTAPAVAVTEDPCSPTGALGGTAVFRVKDIGAVNYTWKKQSDGSTVGDNLSVLTLSNVQPSNEDSYRCIIDDGSGEEDESAAATLWTKRLIAHWDFEGNLYDSEGDWDGFYTDPNESHDDPVADYGSGLLDDGQALQLADDPCHVRITGSEDFFNFYPLGYTFNIWLKTEQTGWGCAVSKQDRTGPNYGWLLDCYGPAHHALREVSGIDSTVSINDGVWHMVTGMYDAEAGVVSLYVDGRLNVESEPSSDVASTNAYPVVFGAEFTDGQVAYEGLLDKASIYSYAVSPVEVAVLYTDVMTGEEICVEQPENDYNDDCRVDLLDFAMFAMGWLECNSVPDCMP